MLQMSEQFSLDEWCNDKYKHKVNLEYESYTKKLILILSILTLLQGNPKIPDFYGLLV
jgi:hypothetical protein